ncbi:cation:proton antiporter [Psychrobium sp. 1_MG-2023]|uniref:cation:proton antiporter n=1 Tax=Psychrobium sp. 1_MG-2023 TaxID=3062624 RepID=UPI000C33C167|nr:cation:proton antiporter [Psychrobium sp. 1_MG-2023]MDP2561603.1 cation:proton antiporter [Psychrobium sp. 1_MG-2023]PKF55623.1 peptidase [Alteromonadales bacterium alter-6D02]
MHLGSGLLALVFVILALFLGALVRYSLKRTQIPYTVALLLLGIMIGLAHRAEYFTGNAEVIGQSFGLVAAIDPHLLLFLFLPTLIFESAFSMEVHLFQRMFTQITLLAVPGLMVAIWLTAELTQVIVPADWGWSWAMCLMFAALISATDPVAVVALLKEVSSRKRLETLIEGESLLNDGTAIVFFSFFYAWVIASFTSNSEAVMSPPWQVVGQFLVVVFVGLAIGLVLGGLCIFWIDRVFNDPMIEITITIAAAYSVFFISESFHVSGVVAVVTLALMFASIGRTRISPEVAGFLHHFWEMMAHIANTLIFLLVGILVAIRVPLDDMAAWKMLFILYLGILLIRASSITLLMPILKRIGIGITFEKAAVLCWGGLRGAVSLALALTVAASEVIPKQVGDHVLFLCAGIVVLTILINGSTMGFLLKMLGLNSLPPAKQATVDKARSTVNVALNEMLPTMMNNQFLQGADWSYVKHKANLHAINKACDAQDITTDDLATAFERRLLETERKHYWTQFEQGILGKQATSRLVEAVEQALDGEPCIGPRTHLLAGWQLPRWLTPLRQYQVFNYLLLRIYFKKLALGYDVARGFILAQEALESHIESLAPNEQAADKVYQLVSQNKLLTLERIDSLRSSFPEIIQALQSQAATRLLLNRERAIIDEQLKQAVLDTPEAMRLLNDVESRMCDLQKLSIFNKSQQQKLTKEIPWAEHLKPATKEQLSTIVENSVYDAGQVICHQQQTFNKVGVISRGSIKVETLFTNEGVEQTRIMTKGPGETIAIESILTQHVIAKYTADTPTDVMWVNNEKLTSLMHKDSALVSAICQLLAEYNHET